MKRFKSGFTLIELLVVIAIIAILAAILFPVFQKVRENARRTACLSNEKQLGLAFIQYNQDADELFPGSDNYGSGWVGRIYPYVKSTGLLKCPDAKDLGLTGTQLPLSYIANRFILNPTYSQVTRPLSLAQMPASATTVLLYEGDIANDGGGTPTYKNSYDPAQTDDVNSLASFGIHDTNSAPIATARHSQGGPAGTNYTNPSVAGFTTGSDNYLLADGHAKYIRWELVSENDLSGVNDSTGTLRNPAYNSNLGSYAVTFWPNN